MNGIAPGPSKMEHVTVDIGPYAYMNLVIQLVSLVFYSFMEFCLFNPLDLLIITNSAIYY